MRAILTSGFKCAVAIIILCVACFESHGSDDSDLDRRSVVSESFDPFSGRLKKDDSAAEQLWWRYRINHGKPITIDRSGDDSFTIEYGDQLTTVDPSKMTRLITVDMSQRSSADGLSRNASLEATENLKFGQTTRVVSQRVIMKQESEEDGKTTSSISDLLGEMDPPMEWVLDRSDLDQSEPGETLLQQTYEIHSSGSVDATIDGQKQTKRYDERVSHVTSLWTVIEKHSSLRVQGTDYRNVIEIELENTVSRTEDSEGVVVYTYWVAKGVGVIKSSSYVPISDLTDGIPFELVDTNLVQ